MHEKVLYCALIGLLNCDLLLDGCGRDKKADAQADINKKSSPARYMTKAALRKFPQHNFD